MGLGQKLRSFFSRKGDEAAPPGTDLPARLRSAVMASQVDIEHRRYDEAARRLEPLVASLDGKSLDSELERISVAARGTLASALFELHRVDEATDLLEECVEDARRLDEREALITTLHELALCYRSLGRQDEGVAACEKAAELAAIDGEDVMPLYTLAIFRYEQQRFEEARDLLEHARDAYENRHELVPLGRVFHELFLVTLQLGDPVRAIEYAHQSIELKLQIGDHVGAGTTMRALMIMKIQRPELFPADDERTHRP